jgi:hypothetical protein
MNGAGVKTALSQALAGEIEIEDAVRDGMHVKLQASSAFMLAGSFSSACRFDYDSEHLFSSSRKFSSACRFDYDTAVRDARSKL